MASSLKATATKDSTSREQTLVRLMNGHTVDTSCFACGDAILTVKPADLVSATLVGGLGAHHDFVATVSGSRHLKGELKHSLTAKTKREVLEWRPWKDAVQFVQGQTKSKKAAIFAPDYGMPLWTAWFDGYVKPFVAASVPSATGLTLDGYVACASAMSCPSTAEPASAELIRVLRSDKELQEGLRKEWIRFETAFMPAHPLDHKAFEAHVKEVLEEKDVWVCVNKAGAHWIEGFHVLGLVYDGPRPKREGGIVFVYTLSVQKKSGGTIKQIPIEFKLYWKNGGQAVQNLNFLVL
uniref:Uncharacterized protein n=1 Tax=viral metagenome TaxID=1070528 RepID=A0A6C0AQQ1_9ZZZZ